MKIRRIRLKNFRCFSEYDVSLGKKITILIGKNGAGKTNLVKALRNGLSFIFAEDKSREQRLGKSSDLHIAKFQLDDAFYDKRDYVYPVRIQIDASISGSEVGWELEKNSYSGKILSQKYKDAFDKFYRIYGNSNKFPLLVYFPDSYPHAESNVGSYAKKILTNSERTPINFGYYQWDSDRSTFQVWMQRFKNSYFAGNDFNTEDEDENKIERIAEIEYINGYLRKFTAPLSSQFDFINSEFVLSAVLLKRVLEGDYRMTFKFRDGGEIFYENLPQGYKRLFSMVIEIAYRSYFLNGVNREPEGIVIIDEIELHLHPSLAQEVLERFSNTFPKVQFIVTTHSPLVISNFNADQDENRVLHLKLEGGKYSNETLPNINGLNYETSLYEYMNVQPRNLRLNSLLDSYNYLVKAGKKEQALIVKNEFIKITGNNNFPAEENKTDNY